METYLHKGDKIEIEGRLQVRSYDDKEGKKRYVSEVMIDHLGFLESKKEDAKKEEPKKEADPFAEFGEEVEIDENSFPF